LRKKEVLRKPHKGKGWKLVINACAARRFLLSRCNLPVLSKSLQLTSWFAVTQQLIMLKSC